MAWWYEEWQNWRCECGEEQPDVSSLRCLLRTWRDPGSCCYWGPGLNIWSCRSGPGPCPWPMLPPNAIKISLVWAIVRGQVIVQRLHRHGPEDSGMAKLACPSLATALSKVSLHLVWVVQQSTLWWPGHGHQFWESENRRAGLTPHHLKHD